MKIWLVVEVDYELYNILGAFTDEALAVRWREAHIEHKVSQYEVTVEEIEIFEHEPVLLQLLTLRWEAGILSERTAPTFEAEATRTWKRPDRGEYASRVPAYYGAQGTDHDAVWAAFMSVLPDDVRATVQANLDAVALVREAHGDGS